MVITTFDDLVVGAKFYFFNQYDEVIEIPFIKVSGTYGCEIFCKGFKPRLLSFKEKDKVQIIKGDR